MKFILTILFLIIIERSVSQNQSTGNNSDNKEGKVQIFQDSRLEKLIEKHIRINESRIGIPGYRVQIFFGTNREEANNVRIKFIERNPEMKVYLLYIQPNFVVRVGDFRTHLEAQKCLDELKPFYETSFMVIDEINFPELE